MTNRFGHRVIAISRIFMKDQWKFLPWWLLSKSEYNEYLLNGSGVKWALLKNLAELKNVPLNHRNANFTMAFFTK